ncbi:MAG: hypothetical protein M3174_07085, partial [Actinomycetota bacterium]|nr:hypothetical protein [Actinomycetota bacterium]
MSKPTRKVLGTLLGACLLAAAVILPAAPAGAGRSRDTGERGVSIAPKAITEGGRGFDYRSLKPKLSKV